MPIKISLLTRHFKSKGGLEKYALRIAQGFAERGAHVDLITSSPPNKSALHPAIHFHTLPLNKWLNFRKVKEFDRLCKEWHAKRNADLIFAMDRTRFQTHLRAGNGVHAAYMKTREKRYPFKAALNPLNRTILKIEKEAFESRELKVLFTNSSMVKREILEYYQVDPDKIEVVHNGVEWKEMQREFDCWKEKKESSCDLLGLDSSHYHFLFIGNGYERKGLSPLLKTLSILPFREFHLSVLGRDRKPNRFIQEAAKLGLSNHVSFFGPRSDTRTFYQIADSLVIPSFYDPFANVTVEALAMGLFVVSSKSNGGHEILSEELGTVIPDLNDIESFREALSIALLRPKTATRSQTIRNGVRDLDFSIQLNALIEKSLDSR
ncbi:MAG: Lipopolysaccharide core biosynthesis protein RfaG [Chlamydiae bacterium]|nr:Lipopolysaccharide core biosynthesis protein RfaG [Chlamydiota bacterium]